MQYKTDAKNQMVEFDYDQYNRVLTMKKYLPPGSGRQSPGNRGAEAVCEAVTFTYDNPVDAGYQANVWGRLSSVEYAGKDCNATWPSGFHFGNKYVEMYAYNQAGQVLKKRLRVKRMVSASGGAVLRTADLDAEWAYDSEGRMTQTKYPVTGTAAANRVFNYGFDDMGRPKTMTDAGSGAALVANVTYGVSSELVSMNGSEGGTSWSESRQYNVMGQMTRLTAAVNGSNALDLGYEFPGVGANNGKVAFQQDYLSGKRVQYLYDSLQRLQKAETVQQGGTQWGQQFGYDGFSNLLSKTVTKGSAPPMSINVNLKNQVVGATYDSNGNDIGLSARSYDVLNRLVSSANGGAEYEYDHMNKRIYRFAAGVDEFYYFGPGAMMGRYSLTVTGVGGANPSMAWTAKETNQWFGGKLVQKSTYALSVTSTWTQQDRLGSVGKYHPYGEEIGTATANDREKFATYTRDAVSGLDYADQRWHSSGAGRFLSGDPSSANVEARDPLSWNKYGYANAAPTNGVDPSGLGTISIDISFVGGEGGGRSTRDECFFSKAGCGPLGSDWNPCGQLGTGFTGNGFINAKLPVAFCYAQLPPPILKPNEVRIECRITVFAQSILFDGVPYMHTWIGVEVRNTVDGETVGWSRGAYEGVNAPKDDPESSNFELKCLVGGCWLAARVSVVGGPGQVNNLVPINTYSGMSTSHATGGLPWSVNTCRIAALIDHNARRFNSSSVTYDLFGPNSNSWVYTLLTMSGVDIVTTGAIHLPGWGITVPWN